MPRSPTMALSFWISASGCDRSFIAGGSAADLREELRGRELVLEGDGVHLAAPSLHLLRADDAIGGPVAALHQVVGAALHDALEGRVLLEPGDQRHALQRRHHREAILERVDG